MITRRGVGQFFTTSFILGARRLRPRRSMLRTITVGTGVTLTITLPRANSKGGVGLDVFARLMPRPVKTAKKTDPHRAKNTSRMRKVRTDNTRNLLMIMMMIRKRLYNKRVRRTLVRTANCFWV